MPDSLPEIHWRILAAAALCAGDAVRRFDRVLIRSAADGVRVDATNGHVGLTLWCAAEVAPGYVAAVAAETATANAKVKGALPLPTVDHDDFPDVDRVLHAPPDAVEKIGFDARFLALPAAIDRALGWKAHKSVAQAWALTLTGALGPATLDKNSVLYYPVELRLTRVRLVVMPCRLDA